MWIFVISILDSHITLWNRWEGGVYDLIACEFGDELLSLAPEK